MDKDNLGTDQMESSFVEKTLGVQVDTKLTMRHQCALAAKKAKSLLVCVRKNVASRKRCDPSLMLNPGVLCPFQGISVQEGLDESSKGP